MTLPAANEGRTGGLLGIGKAGIVCLTWGALDPSSACSSAACPFVLLRVRSLATGLCYVPQASPQYSCFIFKCSVCVSLFFFFGEVGQNIKKGNATNLRRVRSENISECVRQWRNYLLYENWAKKITPSETQAGRTVQRSGIQMAEDWLPFKFHQQRCFSLCSWFRCGLGSEGGSPTHSQWSGLKDALGMMPSVQAPSASALTKVPLLKVKNVLLYL